mgnify:CR=1 FL=1
MPPCRPASASPMTASASSARKRIHHEGTKGTKRKDGGRLRVGLAGVLGEAARLGWPGAPVRGQGGEGKKRSGFTTKARRARRGKTGERERQVGRGALPGAWDTGFLLERLTSRQGLASLAVAKRQRDDDLRRNLPDCRKTFLPVPQSGMNRKGRSHVLPELWRRSRSGRCQIGRAHV